MLEVVCLLNAGVATFLSHFWGVLAVEPILVYLKLAYLEFLFKTKS